MNLLEVKNIKKSFDDLEVLKDISMSVAARLSRFSDHPAPENQPSCAA